MNCLMVILVLGTSMVCVLHGQDDFPPFPDPFGTDQDDPFRNLGGFDAPFDRRERERADREREDRDRVSRQRQDTILPACREKVADVFFILDSSSSIYVEDHYRHRNFVQNMVRQFDVDNRYTRVGALTFSDNYRVSFSLSQHRSKPDVVQAINDPNIPYLSGLTNTASAIRYVRENVQFRQDITRVIVVFTDGYSAEPGSTSAEADRARREGNYIFVIGVGQYTDEREWRAIASDPDDQFMYNFTNYQQRSDRLQNLLAQRICSLPPLIINRIQTCSVRRSGAEIMFVAGANDAEEALPVIDTILDNISAQPGQVQMSLQVSGCSEAENVPLGDTENYCGFNNNNPEDFLTLLKRMRQNAANFRDRARGTNQIAVIFVDNPTLLEFDRFEIYSITRDLSRDGITLYVVDLGDGSNRDLERIARGNVFTLNDRFQGNSVGRLLNRVCEDVNAVPFTVPTRPPL